MYEGTLVERIEKGTYTVNIYKSQDGKGYDYEIKEGDVHIETKYEAGRNLEVIKKNLTEWLDEQED